MSVHPNDYSWRVRQNMNSGLYPEYAEKAAREGYPPRQRERSPDEILGMALALECQRIHMSKAKASEIMSGRVWEALGKKARELIEAENDD